jgi:hypothetical protein
MFLRYASNVDYAFLLAKSKPSGLGTTLKYWIILISESLDIRLKEFYCTFNAAILMCEKWSFHKATNDHTET